MEKTTIEIGSDYMDFVCKFHHAIVKQNIMLVYEGEVTQTITKAFTSMTEKGFEDAGEDSPKTQKRVYHVMVECLQNLCKHADDAHMLDTESSGRGIFMISNDREKYSVTTGNIIANDKIDNIKSLIDHFNSLSPDEIKDEYKRMIKESRLSEKAGAGLGFIDIVKKTGNKIEYHFEKINDQNSFFIQKSVITRE